MLLTQIHRAKGLTHIAEGQQVATAVRLKEEGDWVVLARVSKLDPGVREHLDEMGHRQWLLQPETMKGKAVQFRTIYGKGWWKTGSK